MAGVLKENLPFELPPVEEDKTEKNLNENQVGESLDLSVEDVIEMEQVYKKEIPEFQQLIRMFSMEREIARRERRLSKFPKSLSQWQPAGGQLHHSCKALLDAIHSGPETSVVTFLQYFVESKRHSRDFIYVSRQHPSKRPSVVCFHQSSAGKLKFGELANIYKHSFALKEYLWLAVHLYTEVEFDSHSGLWWSENSKGQTIPVLLCKVSPPLTIASEGSKIWFLDAIAFSDLDDKREASPSAIK